MNGGSNSSGASSAPCGTMCLRTFLSTTSAAAPGLVIEVMYRLTSTSSHTGPTTSVFWHSAWSTSVHAARESASSSGSTVPPWPLTHVRMFSPNALRRALSTRRSSVIGPKRTVTLAHAPSCFVYATVSSPGNACTSRAITLSHAHMVSKVAHRAGSKPSWCRTKISRRISSLARIQIRHVFGTVVRPEACTSPCTEFVPRFGRKISARTLRGKM